MNGMRNYGSGDLRDINNETNILPLKSDIHGIFDDRCFAIVPKKAEDGTLRYVSHILSKRAEEFWPSHHNILVQSLKQDSRPYLFARFAWAILFQMKAFVCEGPARRVVQLRNDAGKLRPESQDFNGMQLRHMYGGGGSQNSTPASKKRRSGAAQDRDDGFAESSSEDSDVDMEDMEGCWNIQWAGRRRYKQRSSDETAPDAEPPLPADVEADLKAAVSQLIASQGSPEHDDKMGLPLQ